MNTRIVLSAFFACVVFCSMTMPALAAEGVKSYPGTSPFTLDEYSRSGSSVNLTFQSEEQGGNASAKVYCGAPMGGKWSAVDKDVKGTCWDYEFCYDVPTRDVGTIKATHLAGKTITKQTYKAGTNNQVTNLCYQVVKNATASDVAVDPYSKCQSGNLLNPSKKKVCGFDAQSPSQIKANTGDDMFQLLPPANANANGAYIEYTNIPSLDDNTRLKWIERLSGAKPGTPLMVPSGPQSSFADYKDFMRNPPSNEARVEDACYPATFEMCTQTPPPQSPPTPGLCGSANGGTFASIGSIPPSGRCYVGTPTAITQSGNKFVWSCQGIPNTEKADSCSASKQSEDIVRPEPPPVGEIAPPSNYCFFHVSGMLIGKDPVPMWFSQIGVTDFASNMVGPGEYAKSQPFANADMFTFDGIAIGRDTTVTIYAKPNFQGGVILHQKGPAVINNRIWASFAQAQNGWQTSTWPGEFHGQFPPSSRSYSSSDMHAWGHGTSVKVTCSMPGSCASYGGEYTSQPATNTANACGAGSYSDLSDTDASYRWACTGTDGIARTCAATKKIILNSGECKGYTGEFTSQPANNAASGCAVGSYKDLGDTETAFRWSCAGTDKIDRTCSVKKKVVVTTPGVCSIFGGTHNSQPANAGNGCTSGSYRDLTDSDAAFHWGCIGTDDVEQICGAQKKKLVCRYDANNRVIQRAGYPRGGGCAYKNGGTGATMNICLSGVGDTKWGYLLNGACVDKSAVTVGKERYWLRNVSCGLGETIWFKEYEICNWE